MKYIQAYEKKLNKKFWILETNPETFQLALDKIGMNKNDSLYTFLLNRYVFKWKELINKNPRIIVVFDGSQWGYDSDNLSNRTWLEEEMSFQNMGEIKIPDYEKDSIKYNL